MGDWPLHGSMVQMAFISQDPTAVTFGKNLVTGAANTKNASWLELIASTPFHAHSLIVLPGPDDPTDYLIDIAIGAAGSEVIIINNLTHSHGNTLYYGQNVVSMFQIPVNIPAGTRISVKAQGYAATKTISFSAYILNNNNFKGIYPTGKIITYGANTADSGGVSIDPGGTVKTKGAWSEITSSCEALQGLVMAFGNQRNANRAWAGWIIDLGIGAAGSEQVLIPDWGLMGNQTTSALTPTYSPYLPISIPAGTRLSMRAACYINDATDRLIDGFIYGVA